MAVTDTELAQVEWDLSHLLTGSDYEAEPGASPISDSPKDAVVELFDRAQALADEFADAHEGKLAEIDGAGLRKAMDDLARISELAGAAGSYAHLAFAANTADPANGALLALARERSTAISKRLLFFDLEWVELDDERAEELLAADGLEFCRHYLRSERRYKPHLLTKPEEALATEMSVTGRGAWVRLFDELTSAIEVAGVPGEESAVALDVALSKLHDPDREIRRSVAGAITTALQPGLRTRAYIFNTIAQDKSIVDRLRSYPSWIASRNLSNEASDESVSALVEAVTARYDLARRWYAAKARHLGVDRLADYDRMAPIGADSGEIGWSEGREIVLDAFGSFSEEARGVANRFFEEAWLDGPPREGKRGGAFSASTVPTIHPYVMLNYTGKRRDVLTVAHELGHGVHQTLARVQGPFHQNTALTVAETASVFAEEVVFGRLLAETSDPEARLSLLAESVEGQIATVFRQIAMNRFEDRVHNERREEGELSVERFCELWAETQTDLLGDTVEVTDGYRSWWSYVPHFISTPGYVYAYSFGQLLALSVYRLYEEQGSEMTADYIEMLRAGGSRSPEDLAAIVGVDLGDPGFWDAGLDLVDERISAAEEAVTAAAG